MGNFAKVEFSHLQPMSARNRCENAGCTQLIQDGELMKRTICLVGVLLGLACGLPAQAASAKTGNTAAPKVKAKAAAVKKTVKPASRTRKPAARKAGKPARKSVRPAPASPVLNSPIKSNALTGDATAGRGDEIKARSAPDRAYAVDGESFFYQGRRYRIAGMEGADGSDMAKQRLQQSLESGSLMIDPHSTDENGVSTATVRINGRDIASQLR